MTASNSIEATTNLPETVISSSSRGKLTQIGRDLYAYRELFRAFVARDIKVRYKQTALGVVWVVLQPLLASGIFAVVFRKIGAMSDATAMESLLFFMAALVPWNTFQMAVANSSTSMEQSANLISKIYFPRMIVPLSYIVGSIIDFIIAFAVLFTLGIILGKPVLFLVAGLIIFLPIQLAFAGGLGLILGSLNAQYRDIKYAVPFLLMIGMLITVLIPINDWSPIVQQILSLNPMASVVEGYRALLNPDVPLNIILTIKGAVVSILIFIIGIIIFRSREARLVDII